MKIKIGQTSKVSWKEVWIREASRFPDFDRDTEENKIILIKEGDYRLIKDKGFLHRAFLEKDIPDPRRRKCANHIDGVDIIHDRFHDGSGELIWLERKSRFKVEKDLTKCIDKVIHGLKELKYKFGKYDNPDFYTLCNFGYVAPHSMYADTDKIMYVYHVEYQS